MLHRAAVTIDVDSLRFYAEIHGLSLPSIGDAAEDPIYTVALPRFWELVSEARIPVTLFLIGADAPRYPAQFAAASSLGAEVASHSYAHDYRLTERTFDDILGDLRRAHEALKPLAPDGRIAGFRAPGYNTSRDLLSAAKTVGYAYDSSLLPSPIYFAVRALAIGAYSLLGRGSRSLRGSLPAFSGPREPYPVDFDRPWRSSASYGLIGRPKACEPLTRAPLIGTTWILAGPRLRNTMLRSALDRLHFLNFEMHAIDLLDGSDRGVPAELRDAQRDLRIPAREKMGAFRNLFRRLSAAAPVMTLSRVAAELAPGGPARESAQS